MNPSSNIQGPGGSDPKLHVDYDLLVHKLRIAIRVRVFDFASPRR
jgi:hypothetical protein